MSVEMAAGAVTRTSVMPSALFYRNAEAETECKRPAFSTAAAYVVRGCGRFAPWIAMYIHIAIHWVDVAAPLATCALLLHEYNTMVEHGNMSVCWTFDHPILLRPLAQL